ncbi:helix-turn-helix transcriptional regulator [Pedobacter panaciterrae]|jgi:AraC-type DNA-binding domain-containing proteins|uniref:helix-turn-helix transcriptional regulator n=1 Tax=Pedobacter panaciterrae TaxID=363849 RepID=UPI001FEB5AF1|nr:helix-turn-helix transcriptional regulator [Pedobacter panaciterrae]
MHSNFKFQSAFAESEIFTFNTLPHFCTTALHMGQARKFSLMEGEVLLQSISHYLAHIELFEYSLRQDASIDFLISEPSFLMYVVQHKSACFLCYRPAGEYHKILPAGRHKILVITFSPDWLIYKSKKLTALKPLIACFNESDNRHVNLPAFGISTSIFNLLIKMDVKTNDLAMDADFYNFINSCINKYYKRLVGGDITSVYYQKKASAIAEFVKKNFATELVDDLPDLAARFMMSQRNLMRLSKMAFGIPLHAQVIKIRMYYGVKYLLTTNKPIHEIAGLVGYKDPHYFSSAFKKCFGVSPKFLIQG